MTIEMTLRSLMEDEYRLVQPKISLIRAGGDGNSTYKIVSNDVPFIARIYGGKTLKNPDWARYELELLIHLAKNGISVAAPIPSFRGRCLDFLLNLDGSPAPAALFNFAEGSVEWPASPDRATLLGASFAELHKASDDFKSTAYPRIFDTERILHKPLHLMRPFLNDSDSQDAAAWQTLQQTAHLAQTLLEKIPSAGGSFDSIHGDLHQENCHFHSTETEEPLKIFRLKQCRNWLEGL